MKVLFAVNSESVSDAIIKKYQKDYREILSYKNVYYFNAILKEIQQDKSYDRIVISEDLEPFSNNNYDSIDKFIFEKLDSISDEAHDSRGNEISIILIASDRHTKSSSFLVKIFGIGVYNALIGNDRSMEEVCRLINKPRTKKEAKMYYRIDTDDVNYRAENENEVSELEIQNILTHFRKLGKNSEKYVNSFDNIASQYTEEQLKIIINCLPINVKAVLEEYSPKYQEIMSVGGAIVKGVKPSGKVAREDMKRTGVKIDIIENKLNQAKMTKPIVIPNSVKATKSTTAKKVISIGQQKEKNTIIPEKSTKVVTKPENLASKKVVDSKKNVDDIETVKKVKRVPENLENAERKVVKEGSRIVSKADSGVRKTVKPVRKVEEVQTVKKVKKNIEVEDELEDIELPDLDFKNEAISSKKEEEEKIKRRGRPKKKIEEVEEKPKGKRGRPKKKVIQEVTEEPEEIEDLMVPFEEDEIIENPVIEDNELDDLVENTDFSDDDLEDEIDFDDLDDEDDEENLDLDDDFGIEEDDDDDLEDLDDLDDIDSELEPEFTEESFDEFEDYDEYGKYQTSANTGKDEDDIDELYSEDILSDDEEDDIELDDLEDDDNLEFEEEDDEEEEEEEDDDDDDMDYYDEEYIDDESDELLSDLDDTDDLSVLDDLDEDNSSDLISDLDDEEDDELDFSNSNDEDDLSIDGFDDSNSNYDSGFETESLESIKPSIDYSMSSLNSLMAKDKKIVAFIGSPKNGVSFLVNSLADIFASVGINTAILDMTKNKNSYYIYTKNDENLRKIAYTSLENLQMGNAEGIKVKNNLTVYTALPNDGKDYSNAEPILSTIVQNHSLVFIDCDFDTDPSYFGFSQEIYLVQSMDILTIQPLTAFLKELKTQGVLEPEKVKIVINKELKVRGLTSKQIIGGISFYNDPAMSYMTELFNKDLVKYCSIPFDEIAYSKYLECLLNCKISVNGYSKNFMNRLKNLGDMVYPLTSRQTYSPNAGSQGYAQNNFSNSMNSTLNKMKKRF